MRGRGEGRREGEVGRKGTEEDGVNGREGSKEPKTGAGGEGEY